MEILEARILSPHPCSKIKDKRNLTKIWNAHQIVVLQCPWCIRRFKSLNKLPTTIGFVGGKQRNRKNKTGCIRIVLQGLRHGAIQKDAIWEETCRSFKVNYPVLKSEQESHFATCPTQRTVYHSFVCSSIVSTDFWHLSLHFQKLQWWWITRLRQE